MSKHKVGQSGCDPLLPRARTHNLVIRELPDEVLVYDLETHKAHYLNESASLVWKHCDGKTKPAEIASILSAKLDADVSEEIAWLALARLSKARLLEERVVRRKDKTSLSRRDAVKKLGLGAALAIPVVMSIVAPAAAALASCPASNNNKKLGAPGCPCSDNNDCQSNNCNKSKVCV